MDEIFVNEYVIKVESPGHGHTNYKIISTTRGFAEMLGVLQPQIEGIKIRSDTDPQYRASRKVLWTKFATQAPGRTSRISLSFELDPNLDEYHRRTWSQRPLFEYIFLAIFAGILILAGIGAYSVVRFLS